MKNKKLSVLLFYLLLTAVPAATILSASFHPAHENIPDLSPAALLTGTSAGETDTLLREIFPARDLLTSLRARMELLSGRRETAGVFVLDDRLIENTPAVSEKAITQSAERLSAFADRFDGTVSLMLVPTASAIHRNLLPAAADIAPQKSVIDTAYELASEKIGAIDCYSPLSAGRDLSLYYRTDPHWTPLGAYMGYNACAGQMGFSPLAMDRFNIIHASHDFRGSLCERTGYTVTPDTVDIYSAPGADTSGIIIRSFNGSEWTETPDLYDLDLLDEGYAIFPEASPLTIIETSVPKAPSLLIVGDSYMNALAPFLTMHYSTVALADISLPERELRDLLDPNSFDQILFCCTLNSFAELQ